MAAEAQPLAAARWILFEDWNASGRSSECRRSRRTGPTAPEAVPFSTGRWPGWRLPQVSRRQYVARPHPLSQQIGHGLQPTRRRGHGVRHGSRGATAVRTRRRGRGSRRVACRGLPISSRRPLGAVLVRRSRASSRRPVCRTVAGGLRFPTPMTRTRLSSDRRVAPYGMTGGAPWGSVAGGSSAPAAPCGRSTGGTPCRSRLATGLSP
jgi:hypothetical protein